MYEYKVPEGQIADRIWLFSDSQVDCTVLLECSAEIDATISYFMIDVNGKYGALGAEHA